jgi:diguanylate cyclase (GGDEF)-like protein
MSSERAEAVRPLRGGRRSIRLRLPDGDSAVWVMLTLLVISLLGVTLGRVLQLTTAWTWIFLPAILLVTLRWGLARGVVVAAASHLYVLTYLLPPLGSPTAFDTRAYLRLATSLVGMICAVATVAAVNRRRADAERREKVQSDSLREIASRISSSLDLDQVLQTVAESARRLMAADMAQIGLAEADGSLRVVAITGGRVQSPAGGWVIAPGKGAGGRVLAAGAPIQVADYHTAPAIESSPQLDANAAAEGVRSLLAVPIVRESAVDGVLWVFSRRQRRFTQQEIALLEGLALHAAVGIANARTHGEELAARAEVESLLAITARLGEQAEPEQVLRTLVEEAAQLLEAERSIYAVLRDGKLVLPAEFKGGRWAFEPRATREQSILWRVWDSGRPYRVDDVGEDPNADLERVRQSGARSQLTMALRAADGENLGLISVNNKRGGRSFSERDERLLAAVCETGSAILVRANETAGRLEAERSAARSRRMVEALLAVADQLNSTLEPEEVLLRVASTAAELLAVRFASIVTNEGDHALSRYRWRDGVWQASTRRLSLEGSVSGWVITHGQAIRTERLPGGERRPLPDGTILSGAGPVPGENTADTRLSMSVPIVGRSGQVLGVLHLYDRRDGQPFLDDDQQLAEGIAHHASVALERAALVKELRERERHLHRQAVTDSLTGLPNRRLFLERLEKARDKAADTGSGMAVVYIDLDGFKVINDSLGHATGDTLLRLVARRLARGSRAPDTVARLGGDEFAILLADIENADAAVKIAERALAKFEQPFSHSRREQLRVSASAGVGFRRFVDTDGTAEDLLREADIALYHAKARGKANAVLYEPSMGAEATEKLSLQTELQEALVRGELRLYYQPIIRLDTRETVAMEALLRWQHPRHGLLEPSTFMTLAEETALILPIGHWVLREACRQAVAWRRAESTRSLRICVNLSARQFEQPGLPAAVAKVLAETGLDPTALELEITETAAIRNLSTAISTLQALRASGVRIAVDDFGTGYSSLNYLKQLPVDTLKLDRSLLDGLAQRGATAAIVQAATTMAHALGIDVTAEGIELEDQLSAVISLGCDFAQGYLIAAPSPPELALPSTRGSAAAGGRLLTA